jgi:hypothetical protein
MTAPVAILVLGVTLTALVTVYSRSRRARPTPPPSTQRRRILFPFVAEALCADALDCALRLAATEHATLVPAILACVPLTLPLQAALPQHGAISLRLQAAIEQRASRFGVRVDARIERGRTYRHALRQAIATSATTGSSSPPRTPTPPASPPTMPAGCSTTPAGRSSSSDPTPRNASHHQAHSARQNPSQALRQPAKRTITRQSPRQARTWARPNPVRRDLSSAPSHQGRRFAA